eukprot:g44943.t1
MESLSWALDGGERGGVGAGIEPPADAGKDASAGGVSGECGLDEGVAGRLQAVLNAVQKCLQHRGVDNVIKDDVGDEFDYMDFNSSAVARAMIYKHVPTCRNVLQQTTSNKPQYKPNLIKKPWKGSSHQQLAVYKCRILPHPLSAHYLSHDPSHTVT